MQVSIHEAIQLTGRSQATIYRLIKQPDSKDFVKKLNDSYTIDKDYLLKVYPSRTAASTDTYSDQARNYAYFSENPHAATDKNQGEPELFLKQERESFQKLIQEKDKRIEDFQKSIESKNSTINKLASLLDTAHTNIAQLTERTREQNIIIQSLQEKVSYQLLKSPEVLQPAEKKKMPLTEQILLSVAFVSAVALIGFIVLMIYAYVSN